LAIYLQFVLEMKIPLIKQNKKETWSFTSRVAAGSGFLLLLCAAIYLGYGHFAEGSIAEEQVAEGSVGASLAKDICTTYESMGGRDGTKIPDSSCMRGSCNKERGPAYCGKDSYCYCNFGHIFNTDLKKCIPCGGVNGEEILRNPNPDRCLELDAAKCQMRLGCIWSLMAKTCVLINDPHNFWDVVNAVEESAQDRVAAVGSLGHTNTWAQRNMGRHLSKSDGYSFQGGGMGSVFRYGPPLLALNKFVWGVSTPNEVFKDSVIGSNSGGGWLVSEMMYLPGWNEIFEKFNNRKGDKDHDQWFEFDREWRKLYTPLLQDQWDNLYGANANPPNKYQDDKQAPMNQYADAINTRYNDKPNVWRRYLSMVHDRFNLAGANEDWGTTTWYTTTNMMTWYNWATGYGDGETPRKITVDLPDFSNSIMKAGKKIVPTFMTYRRITRNIKEAACVAVIPEFQKLGGFLKMKAGGTTYVVDPFQIQDAVVGGVTHSVDFTSIERLQEANLLEEDGHSSTALDSRILGGPSSDALGVPAALGSFTATGASIDVGLMRGARWLTGLGPTNALDFEKVLWRSKEFTKPEGISAPAPGLSFVDGGPTDNSGLVSAVKGIQDKFRLQSGEVPRKTFKILSFMTDYGKQLPLLFEHSPAAYPVNGNKEGSVNQVSPYPWIFDRYITLDHRRTGDGWHTDIGEKSYGGVEGIDIITILAKTRDNEDWGIEKNWFFEITIIDVRVAIDCVPTDKDGRTLTSKDRFDLRMKEFKPFDQEWFNPASEIYRQMQNMFNVAIAVDEIPQKSKKAE